VKCKENISVTIYAFYYSRESISKILEYKNDQIKSYIFHHFYQPVFTVITFPKFKERLCYRN